MVRQVLPDQPDQLVLQVVLDLPGLQGPQEPLEAQDRLEVQDLREIRVLRALQVLLVPEITQAKLSRH